MNIPTEIKARLEYADCENPVVYNSMLDLYTEIIQLIYDDLLKIADTGEYEDMRREVERYFNHKKTPTCRCGNPDDTSRVHRVGPWCYVKGSMADVLRPK